MGWGNGKQEVVWVMGKVWASVFVGRGRLSWVDTRVQTLTVGSSLCAPPSCPFSQLAALEPQLAFLLALSTSIIDEISLMSFHPRQCQLSQCVLPWQEPRWLAQNNGRGSYADQNIPNNNTCSAGHLKRLAKHGMQQAQGLFTSSVCNKLELRAIVVFLLPFSPPHGV